MAYFITSTSRWDRVVVVVVVVVVLPGAVISFLDYTPTATLQVAAKRVVITAMPRQCNATTTTTTTITTLC